MVISEKKALNIVDEFLNALKSIDNNSILALYLIGSLGGGYYRPGQSDIDTALIIKKNSVLTQENTDVIAHNYYKKYRVPKGFGAIVVCESELYPPYEKSVKEEFAFSYEIARLKIQGKLLYGSYDLNVVPMPTKKQLMKDEIIMQKWLNKEFGYLMFDKLSATGCVNCILGSMRTYLMIKHGIFEFNKFKTIKAYMKTSPHVFDYKINDFINGYLKGESKVDDVIHLSLRNFGIKIRDYMNKDLLGVDLC